MTISLSVDYVATANIGQWFQIDPRVVKTGSALGFAGALITADGEVIARTSAIFRVLA